MTVKQLKQKLEWVDETLFVYITQNDDSYENSLVQAADVVDIEFTDGGGLPKATDNAFLITDEI